MASSNDVYEKVSLSYIDEKPKLRYAGFSTSVAVWAILGTTVCGIM